MLTQSYSQHRLQIYQDVLHLHYQAQVGHIGSALSCIDLIGTLWFDHLSANDRFILSKGHAATALYAVLKARGFIDSELFNTFHTNGTILGIHPTSALGEYTAFPTGSLGHGLSLASGIAQGMSFKHQPGKVFVLMSDGECNTGQTWEAAAYITGKHLNNVVPIIDHNGFQAFGKTKDVIGDSASIKRWRGFGYNVIAVDGHQPTQISQALKQVYQNQNIPHVIIAHTTKGFGVSYMENTLDWHYLPMNEKQYHKALKSLLKKLKLTSSKVTYA